MPYEWDEMGSRYWVDEQGNSTSAPPMGALETVAVQAGDRFHRMGRGIRSAFGADVDQEAQEAERLMAPVEAESPYLSMAGDALPSLATLPVSAGGALANFALQTGLGAAEGYLDYDTRASGGQRALAGAAGGVLGEGAGRVMGRIWNTAKGLAGDILLPRGRAVNPAAQTFEEMGGQTMAYQRLAQDTPAADLSMRAAQGAEASINPPSVMRGIMSENDRLFRDQASEAVGLPTGYNNLGQQWKSDALDNFARQYREVESAAFGAGELDISEKLAARLLKNSEIKAAIDEDALFKGLSDGKLAPGEYLEARDAINDHIGRMYSRGSNKRAIRAEGLLNELDGRVSEKLPAGFRDNFARLREQNRVFMLMERKNVINSEGQINVKTLRDTLDSKASGFGRTATAGGETTNPETRKLIDLMHAADNPEFKAFRTSGTAENLQLGQMVDQGAEAVAGALAGDIRPGLGFIGRAVTPGLIGASQRGAGRTFEGAFTPAPQTMRNIGAFSGRSLLDEYLYPFVGAEDERVPQ
jgi:hypothetical protein